MSECGCQRRCRLFHDWGIVSVAKKAVYSALAGYATGGSEGVWGEQWQALKRCYRCGTEKIKVIR